MIRPCTFLGTVGVASAVVLQELTMSSQVSKMIDAWTKSSLDSGMAQPLDTGSTMRAVMEHIDVQSAARAVAHKLSPDVQSMVQVVARGEGTEEPFSEESLKKARTALNELIEKGWIEIDDKIMQCKGFEDMNRNNYGQVTLDIARLIQQINDLERVEAEAVEGINTKDQEIHSVEELLDRETAEYNQDYAVNSAQLTVYQNDMDVFQFIMTFTKCADGTSLAQFQICQTDSGTRVLRFDDQAKDTKFRKMLTSQAMRRLDKLLRTVEPASRASLLQEEPTAEHDGNEVRATAKGHNNLKAMVNNVPLSQREGVVNGATPYEMNVKCPPEGAGGAECPDCCGMLHDRLSLMWGEHKDKVDELTMIMMKNQYEFGELKTNLNSQIDVLKTAKGRLNELLGEARSNLAADNEELKQKYQQKGELDKQYVEYMKHCKPNLFFVCAMITVRNAVHAKSEDCPPAKMTDCDVSAWVPSECSVSCDDSCDSSKPYMCGGWQEMRRDVIVPANECVAACPRLSLFKRCGQYKCPINCVMSDWSGWSKCTAECNGGVQGRTRSIYMKPKNGGTSCNTVEDQQPCGTISCDRNCMLASWSRWTPCSMACGGGFQERYRHVAIPIRGFGRCPSESSRYRYMKGSCNQQDCIGNEECMAKQDLVIAIDGSGSIKSGGFLVLKNFVKKLLARYNTEYWGDEAVKLAIVLFGNGIIMPDGKTVSPAILEQPLTFIKQDVIDKVDAMPFKKGFTNMAQAFSAAETAFILGSRREASSAVMVITDGRPSFNFMTNEMVEQLDDKGITRYFLLVNQEDLNSDSNKVMKSWASQPWETNVVHVPGGLELLEADLDLWAEKALVKFCPKAFSPSEMEWEEISYGYAHVKAGGYCGELLDKENFLGKSGSVEECAALVSGAGGQSFIYGVSFRQGTCIMGAKEVVVDMAQYALWQKNRAKPLCPLGDAAENDGWHSTTLYDFYAMEPADDMVDR